MKKLSKISLIMIILILLISTSCKKCNKCNDNPVYGGTPDCMHKDDNKDYICDLCKEELEKPNDCTHKDENTDYICDLCNKELSKPVVESKIDIVSVYKKIEIKDEQLANYDFKSLFRITKNDKEINVLDEYIDLGDIKTNYEFDKTYEIICEYEGKTSKVEVVILKTIYEITLETSEITINKDLVASYDFKSLFKITKDGKKVNITDQMITSNVIPVKGEYEYTISYKGISKTLHIIVTDSHKIEIIPSYTELTLKLSEVSNFNFKQLFLLYVDGIITEITSDMLNFTSIDNPKIGEVYNLELTYKIEEDILASSIIINVVKDDDILINSKNIVIYPNQEQVDLCSLFTITKGDEIIKVTNDMISGTVNYEIEGINEITLSYEGLVKIATVEVKRGVIIDYAYSDTIIIVKGTNQSLYSFMDDFKVLINGIQFEHLSDQYIKETNVDFNTTGEYELTISIPYNDKKFGLSGVKFDYYEKTIKYVVVDNDYKINLKEENVILPINTTEYNVFKNLTVLINGKNQTLTQNIDYVDPITCYAELLSEPVDFTTVETQEIIIAVYVNGVNLDPVLVKYNLQIESNIKVNSKDITIYSGSTLYPNELFSVYNGNDEVEVTNDMISGVLDLFTPGKYSLEISYLGINAISNIVVLDSNMKGNYIANINTFYVEEETDDSLTDDDWYNQSYEVSTVETSFTDLERELKILDDGTILYQRKEIEIIEGIDESTFKVKIGSNEFTLYYENGIIVLDPNNDIKLTYNNEKLPMVFFNTNIWTLNDKVVINYGTNHVLDTNFVTYSIDCYKLINNKSGIETWFSMKIHLIDKMSSDTVYTVEWNFAEFDDNFKQVANIQSKITFNNQTYKFTMLDNNRGTINKDSNSKEYANKIFNGAINGKNSELRANEHESYSLFIDEKLILNANIADINNMANGGTNHLNKTIFIYDFEENIYSYKFNVDPENNTFEYIEKDLYFGLYQSDNMYIFIDGYGTGIINFDSKSYYEYQFEYEVLNGYIKLSFINTKPTFTYGKEMTLYIPEFLNVMEIKNSNNKSLIGIRLENTEITTGAIVRINSYQVGQDSDAVAKANLLNNIEIITSNGTLTNDEKSKLVDTSKIRFSTPGFYQLTISININEKTLTQYYGVEVLEAMYLDNPVIGAYGTGIIYNEYSFEINKYGQATLICNNVIYNGMIKINDDNSFIVNAYNNDRQQVKIQGSYLKEGLILIKCSGNITFNDYFTKGQSKVIGTTGSILREISYNGENTYIYSKALTLLGEIVDINLISGSSINNIRTIIEILTSETTLYAQVNSWGNTKDGLILSDIYRGTYKCEGKEDIYLNGFGSALIGEVNATYTMNGRNGVLVSSSKTIACNFNLEDKTYTILDVKFDNSLVENKTFVAEHSFSCGYYQYTATTKFVFGTDGVVTVISTSNSHNLGEDACTEDIYEPPFTSKDGTKGTYSVSGNILTISVNGYIFTFTINEIFNTNTITCKSTTLENNVHGYFKVGTIFTKA